MKNSHIFCSAGHGDFVLQRAVEAAHALADPSPPWTEILRSGRELVGAEGATFIVFEGRRLATFESVGNDPATERAYVQYYSAQDIMLEPDNPRPGGTWLDTEDKLSRIDRQRNEYYVDFMCGYRMRQIHSLVLEEGGRSASISFQRATMRADGAALRASPRIGRYAQAVLAAVARRLDRASRWMQALEGAATAFGEGVMLLDARARVLRQCVRSAALLEESRSGLSLRQGALWHADARVRDALASALARLNFGAAGVQQMRLPGAAGGGCRLELARAPVPLRLGGESMAIVRLKLERASAALSDPSLLCAAFGLTGAEARVLCALLEGQTPAAHAHSQGVTIHTVRRQIAVIMQKMGCNRQADLIRLALSAG
jgi:DNA-binding CsgD family transcriptional regulator